MKISVIICTYNYAHFLSDALRTLAAQTFREFELLIVDDGSTDNTEEVVWRFSHQLPKCAYLKKAHTGVVDSRNFGVQVSSGTHIAFLDADDFWSPEYLDAMREVFEKVPEAELVCCDGLRIYDTGEVFDSLFPAGLPRVCGQLRTARELSSFFPYALPSGMIFAKATYESVGPFDTRYPLQEDWHWLIRAVQKGIFCVRLDRKLVLYRHHAVNSTKRADEAFGQWLAVYTDIWGGKRGDLETEIWARQLTRKHFPGLLARYPAEKSRLLLRQAIQVHGGDTLLSAAHLLTYFGLCRLARSTRWVKHGLRRFCRPAMRIDLHAPPEILFAAVSGQSHKAAAMEVARTP